MAKPLLFSVGPLKWNDTVFAIIRILTGALMLYHGWEVFDAGLMAEYAQWEQFETVPNALALVYVGKGLEFLTGMGFILGFFLRLSALVMAVNMLVVCFFIGNGKFWYQDQHPFLFVLLAILYFFNGSEKWSLDQKIRIFGKNRNS